MDKKRESILLKADDIRITPRKVMIGLESYQIFDIRSVNVEEKISTLLLEKP